MSLWHCGELPNQELLRQRRQREKNLFLCDIVVGFVKDGRTKMVSFLAFYIYVSSCATCEVHYGQKCFFTILRKVSLGCQVIYILLFITTKTTYSRKDPQHELRQGELPTEPHTRQAFTW